MVYNKYKIWWSTLKLICIIQPVYAQINQEHKDKSYTEHIHKFTCGYVFYRAMIRFYKESRGAFFSISKEQYDKRKRERIIYNE